jgi:hypothetical protein
MYFLMTTFFQRLFVERRRQPPLAVKALEKTCIFFRPQPPKDFGIAILFHLTQGVTFVSFFPLHRNLKESFLAASKIPFGIQDKDIQKTEMASKTGFY